MRYIIIGNPTESLAAVERLGIDRVGFFVSGEGGRTESGKEILSFSEMEKRIKNEICVIADVKRSDEYEARLRDMGIKRYFKAFGNQKGYILFGAGTYGKLAYRRLGADNVFCFLDNHKNGTTMMGKKVISFSELSCLLTEHQIMICSPEFSDQMEQQLQEAGIYDYCFYGSDLPQYFCYKRARAVGYAELLASYRISQMEKIVIYGTNGRVEELICEIAFQNDFSQIIGVVDAAKRMEEGPGREIMGIPVITREKALKEAGCIVLNVGRNEDDIRENVSQPGADAKPLIVDLYTADQFFPFYRHSELSRFKDIHRGKRAFIVGNGPSLRIEDLNMLSRHREICFGANKIYRIYDKTDWRADYLCLSDHDVISDCGEELDRLGFENVFWGDCFHSHYVEENPKRQYVHVKYEDFYPNYPGFSDDVTKFVYQGYSVTYDIALQMAAYMGFREIYLIGNDLTSLGAVTDPRNHFMEDYYREGEGEKYKERRTQTDKIMKAFEKAELYSRKNGFRIYNATRGGALEAFERVDFDSLFDLEEPYEAFNSR